MSELGYYAKAKLLEAENERLKAQLRLAVKSLQSIADRNLKETESLWALKAIGPLPEDPKAATDRSGPNISAGAPERPPDGPS